MRKRPGIESTAVSFADAGAHELRQYAAHRFTKDPLVCMRPNAQFGRQAERHLDERAMEIRMTKVRNVSGQTVVEDRRNAVYHRRLRVRERVSRPSPVNLLGPGVSPQVEPARQPWIYP